MGIELETASRIRRSRARFALGVMLLPVMAAMAAESGRWEFVAGGQDIRAFIDPASVVRDGEYVRAEIRVEHAADRDSADKRHRYRVVEQGQAMLCGARKGVNVTTRLLDASGNQLAASSRKREDWGGAMREIPAGTVQERILAKACELAGTAAGAPPAVAAKPEGKAAGAASVGSGVVIAADGLVLTSHHVVEGCAAMTVVDAAKNRASARLVAADARNDLALLRAAAQYPRAAALRQGAPLQAGEAVVVVGYPLVDILGAEPSVTFGYVSAPAGLKGDSASFQISAPVHKGNSGGPILDHSGRVIGIVASKLNALAVAQSAGDLPQNISFGIKGEVAQLFLSTQNVPFQGGAAGVALDKVEAAALGKSITVMVVCRKK